MSSNSDEFINIGKGKLNMSPEEICPSAESRELVPFVKEIYSLGFNEEPNYNKLNFLLAKVLMNSNLAPDDQYEWNKHLNVKSKSEKKKQPSFLLPKDINESFKAEHASMGSV